MAERVQTVGTVVRWDHQRLGVGDHPGQTRSLPVVRFTTQDGREVEAMPRLALDLGVYRTGQPAEVLYDPEDPQDVEVRINGTRRPVLVMLLALVAGLLFLFVVLPMIFSAMD